MKLRDKHCSACTRSTPRLDRGTISLLAPEVPSWKVEDDTLARQFTFPDFVAAMAFANRIAEIAEAEQHHPDLTISYAKVRVSIQTHAVTPPGLTENDFILAARIDQL
jgi:4a-hydroxytetrahydrobiopterin dehydratase